MARQSEKADHVVVYAMAQALKMEIVILTRCKGDGEKFIKIAVDDNSSSQPIILGHDARNNYRSLEPINGMYCALCVFVLLSFFGAYRRNVSHMNNRVVY